ncbi:MAG: hypothetical protein KC910_29030, partial [Candidatus Eremiobacteraeota bacterium]|nr:hypothetical protein [Candidatus Eremiobacteraeota bacterium]
YCSACDKNFGPDERRCRDCNSWLVAGPGPASIDWASPRPQSPGWGVPRATTPTSSGWLGAADNVPGEGKDWAGAPRAKTPRSAGWLGAGEEETETIRASARGSSLASMVDEAIEEATDEFDDESWVENEFTEEDEPFTIDPEEPARPPSQAGLLVLVAVVVALLCAGLFWAPVRQPTPLAVSRSAQTDELMQQARKAADEGRFEVAASLATTAVKDLTEAGADPAQIEAARQFLAETYEQDQDFEKAQAQYGILLESHPDSRAHQSSLARAKESFDKQQRVAAQELLDSAREHLESDASSAIPLAEKALGLFKKHGGGREQLGSCHGVLGLGYYSFEPAKAEEHLVEAVKLCPTAGYGRTLAELRQAQAPQPGPRSKPETVVVMAPPPLPKGAKKSGGGRRPAKPVVVAAPVAAPAPAPTRRPGEAPAFPRPKPGKTLLKPGGENLLDSYNNSN